MLQDQLIELVKKGTVKKLIPFLKSLDEKQKKELVPTVKKLSNEYLKPKETKRGNTSTFQARATSEQTGILLISSFVCMSRADFEKTESPLYILEEKLLNFITDWYVPSWFSDFLNQQKNKEFLNVYISYDRLIMFMQKGYVKPAKDLIVHLLVNSIMEYHDKTYNYTFSPENVRKHSITLKEHIWYLFEEETNLYYATRFKSFKGKEPSENAWLNVMVDLVKDKKLDRHRVLSESLLATNRNFNKLLSGWFADLFTALAPTAAELVSLQKELLTALGSSQSKPVNTVLQAIKKVAGEKKLDISSFLDAIPALLSSDVKTVVASGLGILEMLAKNSPASRDRITIALVQVFIHNNTELQTKAAKLIAEYGDKSNAALQKELSVFYPTMLSAARKLLKDFADNKTTKATKDTTSTKEEVTTISSFTPPPAIAIPASIEDLAFLASQAFDNNEPWHTDILVSSLVRFSPQLTAAELPLFEPAFQRAIKIAQNGMTSTTGYLDQLLSLFFIDYGHWIISHFREAADNIKNVFHKYDVKEKGVVTASWLVAPENSSYTEHWTTYKKVKAFEPYRQLFLDAMTKIKSGSKLPALSAPTHQHGWIMPHTLIDRLHIYQKAKKEPADIDLQIAISRCYIKDTGDAIKYASKQLTGKFRDLLLFLLDDNAQPTSPFHHPAAWIVASLSRNNKKEWKQLESIPYYKKHFLFNDHTGHLPWESAIVEYTMSEYDPKLGKSVKVKKYQKLLRIRKDDSKESSVKKLFGGKLSPSKEHIYMFYDQLTLNVDYMDSEHNDIKRLLSLSPNNPAPLLIDIINICLNDLSSLNESNSRLVLAALQVIYETWDDAGEMEYLLLATCLLVGDKAISSTAAELWLKAVQMDKMDNARLGKMIGIHERIELAPLKRFTDLVANTLFRVSDLHNRKLQVMVESILSELHDDPIKNLKSLLELYIELLAVNKGSITSTAITGKLTIWQKNATLKKHVTALLDA